MTKDDILAHNPGLTRSQLKILKGARICFQQWGIEKTSMNDLARQAGVTRQTVYSYYDNKQAVASAAMIFSAYELATQLLTLIEENDNAYDRLFKGMRLTIEELPKEPYFSLLVFNQLPSVLETALVNQEGLEITVLLFKEIFRGSEVAEADLYELIEFCIRSVLSIVLLRGASTLEGSELEHYLQRYIMSAAGVERLCKPSG